MDCADGHPILAEPDEQLDLASERFRPAEAGATQVEVTGMQFQWFSGIRVQMANSARRKPELIDASAAGRARSPGYQRPRRRMSCNRNDVRAGDREVN